MKLYRILPLILVLLLTACAPGGNQVVNYDTTQDPEDTLHFFGNKYEASNVTVIEDILTGFMAEHNGIYVSYESLKGADYYDALRSREAKGHLDDVFMIDHDTALAFETKGSLADLRDLAENVPFSAAIRSQMETEDGSIYWVPTTVSAFGLYCNLDLLEAHHQTVPKNLGEWEAVCQYFVDQNITPIVANNDISLKTLALAKGFYPLYEQGTQEEVFAQLNQGEVPLSQYLQEGFALAQDFCDKGYIQRETALVTKKTSDDLEQFAQGENPFLLTGAWAAGRVKDMAPTMRFQVVPYPVLEDGTVLVINPDVRLSVAAGGDQEDLAREFVSYFLREENIARFADNQVSFSPLADEHTPSLTEVLPIVESYRSDTPVIGSDSRITFPIWDILADTSKELLSGQPLSELMAQMDDAQGKGSAQP